MILDIKTTSLSFFPFLSLAFFFDHDEATRIDSDNDDEVSQSEGERKIQKETLCLII